MIPIGTFDFQTGNFLTYRYRVRLQVALFNQIYWEEA